MAKTSKIAKNQRRKVLVDRYAERRAELVKVIKDPDASYDEKRDAFLSHFDHYRDVMGVDEGRTAELPFAAAAE